VAPGSGYGMSVVDVVRIGVVICVSYLIAVYAAYLLMLVWSAIEKGRAARHRRFDRLHHVIDSNLTIPVSIIAPVYNEEPLVVTAVRSFLAVQYPEYEVIVVNDGSSDGTLRQLIETFELERIDRYFRRVFETAPVNAIYRSRSDRRLLVVDKENGGKSDALNCGLNLARYRYVCGVDGDTILAPTCLRDGMRLVLHDPERIVGVTGHIAISGRPEEALNDEGRACRVDRRPLLVFQHLDYLRSFFNNRLGWTRLNTMLCAVGAFQVWRRDLLEQVGGFSTDFTCEDIELTFRIHERMRREKRSYAILSLPDTVGITEGPDRVRTLVAQRERWQRVIMETVVHYRRMFLNPRYGTVGLVGVPFFVLSEVIAPAFETLSFATLAVGVVLRAIDPVQFFLVLGSITLVNGIFASAAVLLEDQTSRLYDRRSLAWLVILGPVELFIYRPLLFYARAKGTWRFLRRDRGWHKFQRNVRVPSET
jgi:poly-beta-1,6-N-acetyl-D-glucosamine synthase